MDKKSWYLVGPMTGCYYEAQEWRNKAKKRLNCIDPYEEESNLRPPIPYKNLFEFYKALRGIHDFDRIRREFPAILKINNKSVDEAFGLLCYEPYPIEISSWGTVKEVVRAHRQGKPVVLWSEVPLEKMNFSAITMSTAITHTLADAIKTCKAIESGSFGGEKQ